LRGDGSREHSDVVAGHARREEGAAATASKPRLGEEATRGAAPRRRGGRDRANRGSVAASKTENESKGILVKSLLP
jgi:hypothetical protein